MGTSEFKNYFSGVAETLSKMDMKSVEDVCSAFLDCYNNDGTIYIMGNGGSGATASHVSGDYIKGVSYGLKKRFRIISLNDNMPGILAIANDLTYNDIFTEQLKGGLKKNDLVIGISGSGNSQNVVNALTYAKQQNVRTIAFCGYKGGKIKEIAEMSVHVPVMDMEITEDIHMIVFHAVKQSIIKQLKGDDASMGETYDKRIK
jgi:D-sedoheptulose 7-phosphate isomerase